AVAVAAVRGGGAPAGAAAGPASTSAAGRRDGAGPPSSAPLGQSYRRRTRGRVSASAGRRDIRS
ncbi:MAG: hypothetical protein ACJ8DZ_10620, partial [Allosphingosinicella sp.]